MEKNNIKYFKVYREALKQKYFAPAPSFWVYGYAVRNNSDGTLDYIRDSLTRWTLGKSVAESIEPITEDEFIIKVQQCCLKSGQLDPPSSDKIKKVLQKFEENFEIPFDDIIKIIKENNE